MTFALKHKSTNKSYIPAIKNICRLVIISILASFIVSLTSVLCIDFNFSSFITLWIVSTCILFGSLYLIQARPSSKNPKYKIFNNKLYKYIVRKKQNRILTVILLAILLAILWVPFIAGSAPFYTNVDTIDQIRQIYSVDEWISFTNPPIIEFNNHHPVLDSVIYSLFFCSFSPLKGIETFPSITSPFFQLYIFCSTFLPSLL